MAMKKLKNPWIKSEIEQKARVYIDKYNGETNQKFSWILDGDKDAIRHDKAGDNINWGLPNQIIGNPKTANVFLCLLKMPVRSNKLHRGFKEFVDNENNVAGDEYFTEKELSKYYDHIVNTKENVLSQELRDLKEKNADPYFLTTNYLRLFTENDDVKKEDFLEELKSDQFATDYFDDLKVCNLDLFPYRTNTRKNMILKKDKTFGDLESSRYVASLIIRRILDFSISDEPAFIFRSYPDWAKVIMRTLSEMTGLTKEKDLIPKYNLLTDYFYEISSSQNGMITENNIHKVMKLGEYDNIKDLIWGK
jgi:hypothetical protein